MGQLPKVGMRMVKTSVAVALCFLIARIAGTREPPIFSTIAAIICMQSYVENSIEVSFNRVIGTGIGAIFGLLVVCLTQLLPVDIIFLGDIILAIAVIPVIYTTVLLKKTGAAALAGVVLLSIGTTSVDVSPLFHVMNRSVETLIGIVVSLGVNMVHFPRRKEKEILFISGFDDVLYTDDMGITPYCIFELNQLLKDGIAFTIATERTPAFLEDTMQAIELKLPVIAMDGAVLYDMKNKRYLMCHGISEELVEKIETLLSAMDVHYFLNLVWEDVLLIYYQKFRNPEEKRLYDQSRQSPYRNYVYGQRPEYGCVVYFLLVLKDEVADQVEEKIKTIDKDEDLYFLRSKGESIEGYCHLKVYHKTATKVCMMEKLLNNVVQKKTVVFGSNENDIPMMEKSNFSYTTSQCSGEVQAVANAIITGGAGNSIVREMFHLYEPLPWKKLPNELRFIGETGEENE